MGDTFPLALYLHSERAGVSNNYCFKVFHMHSIIVYAGCTVNFKSIGLSLRSED